MSLFGKKVRCEIATDRSVYVPGDEVQIAVRMHSDEDVIIEAAVVELVYANAYQYRHTPHISGNGGGLMDVVEIPVWGTTVKTWNTSEIVFGSKTLLEKATLRQGGFATDSVSLAIPSEAVPSGTGSITSVAWWVRSRLEIRRASDPTTSVSILVTSPPAQPSPPESTAIVEPNPVCTMTINLERLNAAPGDEIRGTLSVTAHSDLSSPSLGLRLERLEDVWVEKGHRRVDVVSAIVLASDLGEVPAGEDRSFPFSVFVPADACPSLLTANASVRWRLAAHLGRTWHKHVGAQEEINVHTAR